VRLPVLAAATLATVALASACGSSTGGRIPTDTAGSLTTDLTNIQAGVVAGNCPVTNAAIESARIDFEDLPTAINSELRNQLVQGFNTLVLSAELKCQQSSGGGPTGPTSSSSTSSSTTSSSTTTSTSTATTATSSAATTTSSSAASTTATTTGSTCTPITTPNGGTVCVGATGDTSSNGIGGGGGIGGPGT
jgi:peptidoglycan DL-endopeptidase CwlO